MEVDEEILTSNSSAAQIDAFAKRHGTISRSCLLWMLLYDFSCPGEGIRYAGHGHNLVNAHHAMPAISLTQVVASKLA